MWGEAAATGTSPTQPAPKAALMLSKVSVQESVLVYRTVVLVCVVNIFGYLENEMWEQKILFIILYFKER